MLQLFRNAGVETHLVMSKTAELTFAYETGLKIAEVRELANVSHAIDDSLGDSASLLPSGAGDLTASGAYVIHSAPPTNTTNFGH